MEIFKILGRIALDGVDEAGSKLDKLKGIASKLGDGVKVAGKAFAGLSAAVGGIAVAIGTASVKAGSAFDAQMSTVKSISGATAEEFEALKEKAKEMGATTSFSATESAQALEYMAMAGWTTQQMIDGLAGVMNLAAASGEDLATTSDIVTDAMTAFGMQAEESTYFSDVLAKTASSANTNVSMMGETFKYVAPLAGAMGYKIEDMSVAIGLMANSGIKGSQAGTSLRGVITNLATPTDKVSKAMDDLGISLTKSGGEMKPFREVLDEMRDSFSGLDETQRTAYASMIAGKEGMSGLLAMINSSDDDFEELTKEIENCSGAAKEMADVRLDNLSGDVTLFKSALEGAGIAISDQLSPVLREFVQNATAIIPKAQDGIAKFGGKIAEIGSKLLPVLIDTVEELAPVVSEILDIIGDMMPYFTDIIEDVLPLVRPLLDMIIEPLKSIIRNILPTLTDLIGNVAKALKPVIKFLTPIVKLVGEFVSIIDGAVISTVSDFFGMFVDGKDDMLEFSKAEQETIDKTKELSESLEESQKKRDEAMKTIESEYGYYERLWVELESIVDENGKIKEGYEDRALTITGVLSEATGIEMEITGNQIQNYKDLKDSIYDAIEAEKYKAQIEAGRADYEQAVANNDEYFNNMINAQNNADANAQQLSTLKSVLKNFDYMSVEKIQASLEGGERAYGDRGSAYEMLIDQIGELEAEQLVLNQTVDDATGVYNKNIRTQENWAEAYTKKSGLAVEKMKTDFKTATTATLDELKEQSNAYKLSWEERLEAYEKGTAGVTKEETDLLRQLYILSLEEEFNFSQSGENQGKAHASGLESQQGIVKDACEKLSDSGIDGVSSGDYYGTGQSKGSEYASGLMSMINQCLSEGKSAINAFINSNEYNSGTVSMSDYVGAVKAKLPAKTATGGIVTRAQTRIVGEDGAEAIIPLEKNTQWIDKVAERLNGSSASNNAVLEKLSELNDNIKNLKIYLDSGALVGEIAPKMDKKLGSIARLKRRGTAI